MAEFKGFSAAKTAKNSTVMNEEYFSCGLAALEGRNMEEAYLCRNGVPDDH